MIVPAGSLRVIVDQRATELRRQFLLGAGLGPHLRRQRPEAARIGARRSGRVSLRRRRVVAVGIDERNRPIRRSLRRRIGGEWIVLRERGTARRSDADQQRGDRGGSVEAHAHPSHDAIRISRNVGASGTFLLFLEGGRLPATVLQRAFRFRGCPIRRRVVRKPGLRCQVALVDPAEAQCYRLLLVTGPEMADRAREPERPRAKAPPR